MPFALDPAVPTAIPPARPPASASSCRQHISDPGLDQRFLDFVDEQTFPCVGAKTALARDGIRTLLLGRMGDPAQDAPLLDRLDAFSAEIEALPEDTLDVLSLVALFDAPAATDEPTFERLLWAQLQRLHALDVARGTPWAEDVARDPADPRFSMSLAGHPFFVIGLHPGASRLARRFDRPALVFNSHRQFERLRADGRFARIKRATRKRDRALQGSINPNLADFGKASEARQYSGRHVERDWTCPFHARSPH